MTVDGFDLLKESQTRNKKRAGETPLFFILAEKWQELERIMCYNGIIEEYRKTKPPSGGICIYWRNRA